MVISLNFDTLNFYFMKCFGTIHVYRVGNSPYFLWRMDSHQLNPVPRVCFQIPKSIYGVFIIATQTWSYFSVFETFFKANSFQLMLVINSGDTCTWLKTHQEGPWRCRTFDKQNSLHISCSFFLSGSCD